MKRIVLLVALLTAFSLSNFGQVEYSVYENQRFGFSIDYPSSLLKMMPPPENGDGRTFVSDDDTVEMRVWGDNNPQMFDLETKFQQDWGFHPSAPTYKSLYKNGYVISSSKKGKITYQKTICDKADDPAGFYTVTITYPASRKKEFDPIIKRIAKSFKFE